MAADRCGRECSEQHTYEWGKCEAAAYPGEQLDRIEAKLDEVLAFRDLIMETVGPFLTGSKSKVWMALLAKKQAR